MLPSTILSVCLPSGSYLKLAVPLRPERDRSWFRALQV
jgi:hypothetical protein